MHHAFSGSSVTILQVETQDNGDSSETVEAVCVDLLT